MNTTDRDNPLSEETSTGQTGTDAPTVTPGTTGAPTEPTSVAAGTGGYQTSGYPPQTTGGYGPSGYPPPTPGGYGGPAPAPARRLTRSTSDRMLGGVCGGLAQYWNTDPVLLRILTVVLTLATGGALLLGYLIAWIVIPPEPPAPAGGFDAGAGGGTASGEAGYGTAQYGTAHYAPAPRQRSYLGWLVVSIAAVAAGIVSLIGLAVHPTAGTFALVGAVVLTLLGLGMVVGAWYGRARWLTLLAVPLAFLTFSGVAAQHWITDSGGADRWLASTDGGLSVGSRTWEVTPADLARQPLDYRVSVGDAVLDLTALTAAGGAQEGRPAQRVTVDASVGLGQLRVLVPADMRVNLSADLRAGEVLLPDGTTPARSGTDILLEQTIDPLTQGQPAYVVDLDVAIGAGNLEVHRDAA